MKRVLALVIGLAIVTARTEAEPTQASGVSDPKPRQISEARLSLPGREIEIHRAAQPGDNANLGTYFLEPILAFELADQPDDGWPRLVHHVEKRSDRVYLTFRVIASSPDALLEARQRVLDEDTEWLDQMHVEQSRVKVRPWPTTGVLLQLIDRYSKEILASGEEEISSGERDSSYELHVGVDPNKLSLLLERLTAGHVRFKFALRYQGLNVGSGKVIASATHEFRTAVNSSLNSANLSRTAPIFQAQKTAFQRDLDERLSILIAAQSEAVAKMLAQTGIDLKLFSDPEWKDLEGVEPEFLRAVAEYLKPVLQEHKIETANEDTTTRTRTRKLGLKVGFGGEKSPIRFSLSPETEETLTKKYGVTLKTTEEENFYEPHRIAVFQLREGWEQIAQQAVGFAYLTTGVVEGFQDEDVLQADFTAETQAVAKLLAGEAEEVTFAEIPLGAAFCYFGAGGGPPPGYAWVDGRGEWPREAWVPQHLRGKALPDLADRLVGGTANEAHVAEVWEKGYAYLPEPQTSAPARVEGPDLMIKGSLPTDVTVKTIAAEVDLGPPRAIAWHLFPDPLIERTFMGRPVSQLAKREVLSKESFEASKLQVIPNQATVPRFTFPESERRIDLSSPESNPRHVKCRWIVRVR